ncbi:MAG: hypothetical protein RIF41_08730 [Polyangiaceae bacterium]
MTGRRLLPWLPSLSLLLATGCTPVAPPRAASPEPAPTSPPPPAALPPVPPAPLASEPTPAEPHPHDALSEPPEAPADVEVPPAGVGSRDPFNSDVVDQNREGELIIERALTPSIADEAP